MGAQRTRITLLWNSTRRLWRDGVRSLLQKQEILQRTWFCGCLGSSWTAARWHSPWSTQGTCPTEPYTCLPLGVIHFLEWIMKLFRTANIAIFFQTCKSRLFIAPGQKWRKPFIYGQLRLIGMSERQTAPCLYASFYKSNGYANRHTNLNQNRIYAPDNTENAIYQDVVKYPWHIAGRRSLFIQNKNCGRNSTEGDVKVKK